jgi:hypothetical protein
VASVQVAHFLEAPVVSCAKRFWSQSQLVSSHSGAVLPPEAQRALNATTTDIAEAMCQAHPAVTDPSIDLIQELARVTPALHAAVCSAAALARGGTLWLQLCDSASEEALQLASIALPSTRGVHDIHLVISKAAWTRPTAVAAVEALLQVLQAAPALHVAKVTLQRDTRPDGEHEPRKQAGGLLRRFACCLQSIAGRGLRELCSSGQQLHSAAAVRAVAESLAGCSSLTCIDLASLKVECDSLAELAAALPSLPQLRDLGLQMSGAPTRGASALARSFASMPRLRSLHLCAGADAPRTQVAWQAEIVLSRLDDVPGLAALCMPGMHIGRSGTFFGLQLRVCSKLQRLSLQVCAIDDANATGLATGVAGLPELTHLHIACDDHGADEPDADVYGAPDCEPFLQQLAARLSALQSLRSLDVNARTTCEPIAQLVVAMSRLSALQRLRLQGTLLWQEGQRALGVSISRMPDLTSLELRRVELCAAGAAALGSGLAGISSLVELTIHELSGFGVPALCPGIQRQRGLARLLLNGRALDRHVIATLGPAIAGLSALRSLSVRNLYLGDGGVRTLLPHLAPLTQLTHVNLQGNGMSVACVRALRSELRCSRWMAAGAQPFADGC